MDDKEKKEKGEKPPRASSDMPNLGDVLSGVSVQSSPVLIARDISRDDIEEVKEEDEMKGDFVKIDGAVGGTGYDETTVDIIAVPCPGADPLETWTRDALLENYFGGHSMRNSDLRESQHSGSQHTSQGQNSQSKRQDGGQVQRSGSKNSSSSWVRLGIRREASTARVLMYRHQTPVEGTTLSGLADGLLEAIIESRPSAKESPRPIIFICHSIGGLVAKMALCKASRNREFDRVITDCHGIAFFATPHRGSTYLAMPDIAAGIQSLLQLSRPLPRSITGDLRVGHPLLMHMDEEFRPLASDLQIWTFYETIDSKISSATEARPGDVYFAAPITPLKSAILGIRQERIFPLQSDHVNCASFGRNNMQTMKVFLKELGSYVLKADLLSRRSHTQMRLEGRVNIEVHGFYEDPVAVTNDETLTSIRAWSTRVPLSDYIAKGPLELLNDRLNEVAEGPVEAQFLGTRRGTEMMKDDDGIPDLSAASDLDLGQNVLGLQTQGDKASLEVLLSENNVGSTAPNSPRAPASPKNSPNPDVSASMTADRRFSSHSAEQSRTAREAELDRGARSRSTSGGRGPGRSQGPSPPPNSPHSNRSNRRVALQRRFSDQFNQKWSGQLDRTIYRTSAGYHRGRTVADDEDEACIPVFSRPDDSNRRFVWTHLPYTNPIWVKRIFETMEIKEGKDFTDLFNHGHWYSKHTQGRHTQHYAYFVRPGFNLIPPKPMSPLSRQSSAAPDNGPTLYLFLPFLHFDTYRALLRRRALISRRLRQGRTRPVPPSVARLDSPELQVIWEYLGHDPPVNCRRTLDQYGYPSLHDTRPRDDDQMLYKMTKERVVEEEAMLFLEETRKKSKKRASSDVIAADGSHVEQEKKVAADDSSSDSSSSSEDDEPIHVRDEVNDALNGNVLMVDQLWMWAIGPNTLVTFFSKRESDTAEGPLYQQADLRDSIFNDVNSDLSRQCDTAHDMAALIALHAVTVLLDRSSHPDLEVFRIFEEAISILTEKMTSSLKDFRTQSLRPKSPGYDSDEDPAPRSIKARHAEEAARTERSNRDSTSALLELRDLEDELSTLATLFETQRGLLDRMRAAYLRIDSPSGLAFLHDALARLAEYKARADEMIRRARSTREDYDKLLRMVQRQAQVDEVRLQRLQADLASAQGRSVVIFTTFTVIFLPLSFFTSLFGMNTFEWGGESFPRLATIGLIALPASAGLVFVALVAAWSTRVRRFFVAAGNLGQAGVESAGAACLSLGAALAEKTRVKGDRKRLKMKRQREKQRQQREKLRVLQRVGLGGGGGVSAVPAAGAGAAGGGGAAKGKRKVRKEMSAESGDFWERHRLERDDAYAIPVANRKSVVRERVRNRLA